MNKSTNARKRNRKNIKKITKKLSFSQDYILQFRKLSGILYTEKKRSVPGTRKGINIMKFFENLKNAFSYREAEKSKMKELRRYDYR